MGCDASLRGLNLGDAVGLAGRFGEAALGRAGKTILPLMIFASAFGATNGQSNPTITCFSALSIKVINAFIYLYLTPVALACHRGSGSLYTASRLVRESAHKGHFPSFLGRLWQWGPAPTPVPALLSQCKGDKTIFEGVSYLYVRPQTWLARCWWWVATLKL